MGITYLIFVGTISTFAEDSWVFFNSVAALLVGKGKLHRLTI